MRILLVFLILVGFVTWYVWATVTVDTEPVIILETKMKDAYTAQKFGETVKYARRVLAKDPKSTVATLFAAQALMRQDHSMEALDYLLQVVDSETPEAAFCHLLAGQIYSSQLSQFRDAERQYRRAIHLQPNEVEGYQLLEYVLRIGTRNWEMIPLELRQIQNKQMTIESMEQLSRNERVPPDLPVILKGVRENPDDPIVLLGHAHLLRAEQKYADAEALLRKAVKLAPDLDEAHVRLGQVLLERGEDADFVRWEAESSDSVKQYPLYWTLLGRRANVSASWTSPPVVIGNRSSEIPTSRRRIINVDRCLWPWAVTRTRNPFSNDAPGS